MPEYEHFDADLIMHINNVFVILNQMGVGPEIPFSIVDNTATWSGFSNDPSVIGLVKSYMGKKVRLMFDTSGIQSSVLSAIQEQIKEDEWRLNVAVDP